MYVHVHDPQSKAVPPGNFVQLTPCRKYTCATANWPMRNLFRYMYLINRLISIEIFEFDSIWLVPRTFLEGNFKSYKNEINIYLDIIFHFSWWLREGCSLFITLISVTGRENTINSLVFDKSDCDIPSRLTPPWFPSRSSREKQGRKRKTQQRQVSSAILMLRG